MLCCVIFKSEILKKSKDFLIVVVNEAPGSENYGPISGQVYDDLSKSKLNFPVKPLSDTQTGHPKTKPMCTLKASTEYLVIVYVFFF